MAHTQAKQFCARDDTRLCVASAYYCEARDLVERVASDYYAFDDPHPALGGMCYEEIHGLDFPLFPPLSPEMVAKSKLSGAYLTTWASIVKELRLEKLAREMRTAANASKCAPPASTKATFLNMLRLEQAQAASQPPAQAYPPPA